jgi:hypothetical protein
MVESAEGIWEAFEEGRSIGQVGSERGRIILDDSYTDDARITLEVVSRTRFLRTRTSYAITCGIYGWMVHTRFFESEAEARDEFQKMKPSLSAVVERLRLESDDDTQRLIAEISPELHAFISRFP